MTAPALPCGCTRRIVATLEETLACPAGWTYQPGTGWIHQAPDPADPRSGWLRELILAALAEVVVNRRADVGFCTDCTRAVDGLCPDHRDDSALADDYETAYQRISGIGSDGEILRLTRRGWPTWTP